MLCVVLVIGINVLYCNSSMGEEKFERQRAVVNI